MVDGLAPPGSHRDATQTAAEAKLSKKDRLMKSETITQRADLIIRRHILEPGEALPWHTDLCHRFSVVISGEKLSIEYRCSGEIETFPVQAGMADWDAPQPRVHRGINAGTVPYEEVIVFFLPEPNVEPQPEAGESK
jgi:hypothetical protein